MWNYAHVRFRPEAISCRVTNECAFRLPSHFLVDAYGVSISKGTGTAGWVGRPDLEIDRVLARLAYPRISPRDADPLLLVFTPVVRLSRRGFVMPFDGVISSEPWPSFNHS